MDFEDSPTTRLDLAEAYFRAARFDESLSAVTELLTANPDDAPARYLQGKLWLKKQQYDYATKSFGYALSQQDDPAASYLLGASLLQVHHLTEAKEVFGKLRAQVVRTTSLHSFLADAYRAANYMEESRRESQLAGYPGKSQVLPSPIDRVLSNAARLPSRFEPTKPTSRELAGSKSLQKELSKVLANTLNDLGTAEAQQHQYSLALAHFHEAANWNAEVPGLLRNTGIAAARVQDYPECIRALRPVLDEKPGDNVVRSVLGSALFAMHSYAEAVEVFTPLGDSVLQLPELAYSWAASLVRINEYREANSLLDKLEQQQLATETLMLVAQLWSQMGDYEHTVKTCHRALELDPKLPQAHYFAGLALIRLNRAPDATRELQSELQLDPDNLEAQFNLAFSLLQQSQTERALELLKGVVARKPDHAEANYELGKELLVEGKPSEAVNYLEAAVRLKPQFEPAHYQLQSAYRAVGRTDDADREARVYRALKAKNRNITLPPPRQGSAEASPN